MWRTVDGQVLEVDAAVQDVIVICAAEVRRAQQRQRHAVYGRGHDRAVCEEEPSAPRRRNSSTQLTRCKLEAREGQREVRRVVRI